MRGTKGVMAALAALVACGAWAREPQLHGMKAWSQPAYVVFSQDERIAQTLMKEIPPIEGVLATLLERKPQPSGLPTYIFIVRDSVWNRYLAPSFNIVGEFVPSRFANYLLLSTGIDGPARRDAVYHEYSHLFLHTQFRGVLPLWFDEGLAELVGTTRFKAETAIVGIPKSSFRSGWIPLSRLMQLDKKSEAYLTDSTRSVHFQSWAIVHRGFIAEPAFGKQMLAYLNAVNNGMSIDEGVETHFGVSVDELDRQMRRYSSRFSFDAGSIKFVRPPPVPAGPGRELSEVDSLKMLARVMFDTGLKPIRVGEVIAAAEKRAPESPNVSTLKLRLAVRDRDDAAIANLLRLLEPATQNVRVGRDVGVALFERVREIPPDDPLPGELKRQWQQKAMDLLDRSLRADAEDPEAAWGYGLLASALNKDFETALERLERAARFAHMNADIEMATALVYESRQQPERAVGHWMNTARFSHSLEQRLRAGRRVDAIRQAVKTKATP